MDAGNSKTDVAVVTDGRDAAGPASVAPALRLTLTVSSVPVDPGGDVRSALRRAGGPHVHLVKACLANADLPVEEVQIAEQHARPGLGATASMSPTTRSLLLRAGTDQPRGVAVVCGAGINCVGLLPDGAPPASWRWAT